MPGREPSSSTIWHTDTNIDHRNCLLRVIGPTNGKHKLGVSVEQGSDLLLVSFSHEWLGALGCFLLPGSYLVARSLRLRFQRTHRESFAVAIRMLPQAPNTLFEICNCRNGVTRS